VSPGPGPARQLRDLEPDEVRLIRALDTMTPASYRKQERDHRPADDICQEAGLAVVGQPDTRMATATLKLRRLLDSGYVESVKDGANLRYRLTQLAEREMLTADLEALVDRQAKLERHLQEAQQRAMRAEQREARRRDELQEAYRPFWRRWLRLPSAHAEARDPEPIARRFHENYERLAPDFGYETREASAVAWAMVPQQNRELMVATVAALLGEGAIR
jgi:outer membrane lipopolysaccharide assembly protein LptE/RlpB